MPGRSVTRAGVLVGMLIGCSATAADKNKPEASDAPPQVVQAILGCRDISDVEKRAACFDRSVAGFAQAIEQRAVVVLDREEVKNTRRSLFGFSLPRLAIFGGREDSAEQREEIREINSTVKQVGTFGYGLWSLTLAEGGVWRTMEANRNFYPKVGQTIIIKRGPFGNYLAAIQNQPVMRVSRIG